MNETIQLDSEYYKDLSQSVSNLWEIARKSAWEGEPYRHIILRIEDILKDENQIIENRKNAGQDFDFNPLIKLLVHITIITLGSIELWTTETRSSRGGEITLMKSCHL